MGQGAGCKGRSPAGGGGKSRPEAWGTGSHAAAASGPAGAAAAAPGQAIPALSTEAPPPNARLLTAQYVIFDGQVGSLHGLHLQHAPACPSRCGTLAVRLTDVQPHPQHLVASRAFFSNPIPKSPLQAHHWTAVQGTACAPAWQGDTMKCSLSQRASFSA